MLYIFSLLDIGYIQIYDYYILFINGAFMFYNFPLALINAFNLKNATLLIIMLPFCFSFLFFFLNIYFPHICWPISFFSILKTSLCFKCFANTLHLLFKVQPDHLCLWKMTPVHSRASLTFFLSFFVSPKYHLCYFAFPFSP